MYQTRQEMIQKLLNNNQNCTDGGGSSSRTSTSNSSTPSDQPERNSVVRQRHWENIEQLIEDNLREVYEKLPLLEKQIWGKLIVMESNRRTAKAYLRHPVITLDGSDAEFDGTRIGLSRFENLQRVKVVYDIFNEILQGIKIKIDPDGSVWAKRMCTCPVYLKPLYITRPADLFDVDKRPVKVFDIRRFKEILVHELNQVRPNRRKLEKCCMICLELSYHQDNLLVTPCWIIIIHLVAIELLNLVLPKDNDMSSPSSSFVASPPPPPFDLALSPTAGMGFPPPPPPLTQLQSPFERSPARNGQFGRNSRSSGVFRRIQRKEASFENHGAVMPANYFGACGNGFSPANGHPPFGVSYRFGNEMSNHPCMPSMMGAVQPNPIRRSCNSMMDLRQIQNNNQMMQHVDNGNPIDLRTKLRMKQRSIDGGLHDRTFSMDQIDRRTAFNNHMMHPIRPFPNEPQHFVNVNDRLAMKKWRSQDSGIASGSGSYGRR